MRVRTLALIAAIGLLAAGALLLVRTDAGGARERWEARVGELRAAGEPLDADAFRVEAVADEDNAEGLLREVRETYDATWPGDDVTPTDYPFHDGTRRLSEEEREILAAWQPELEPLYERLEAASRRPVLVGTSSDPLDPTLIPWVQQAGQLWRIRTLYRPEEAPATIHQYLRLALAWRPRNQIEVNVRWGLFVHAVQLLHQAVAGGRVDVAKVGPEIRRMLREAEAGWLDDFRLALRAGTAAVVRHVAWSTGQASPPEDAHVVFLPEKYADPEPLYAYASSIVEANTALLRRVQSAADLPAAKPEAGRIDMCLPMNFVSSTVSMLTHVRLARWALWLHEERAAGRPLAADLGAYADRFRDGPPLDPSTGKPFRWVEREEGRLISVDPQRAATLELLTMGFLEQASEPVQDEVLSDSALAWLVPE